MVLRRSECDSSAWVRLFHRSAWKGNSTKFVAATAGALAGALALYALGGWGGRGLVLRYSRVLRVKESDPA